ncbi:hypothetical protein ACJX0J_006343, partial [Zea mays]
AHLRVNGGALAWGLVWVYKLSGFNMFLDEKVMVVLSRVENVHACIEHIDQSLGLSFFLKTISILILFAKSERDALLNFLLNRKTPSICMHIYMTKDIL